MKILKLKSINQVNFNMNNSLENNINENVNIVFNFNSCNQVFENR